MLRFVMMKIEAQTGFQQNKSHSGFGELHESQQQNLSTARPRLGNFQTFAASLCAFAFGIFTGQYVIHTGQNSFIKKPSTSSTVFSYKFSRYSTLKRDRVVWPPSYNSDLSFATEPTSKDNSVSFLTVT